MKQREIKPGLYRHFNGGMYRVLSTATHTETGEKLVIYQDEKSGKVWARPYEMFAALVDREQFAREEGSMDDLEALHGLSGEQAGRVGGCMMKTDELVKRLLEYAEWARVNEWEVPITLADALEAAADTIERLDNKE